MTEQNINSEIKRIQNAIEDAYNKGDSHTYIAVGPTDAYKQFSNYGCKVELLDNGIAKITWNNTMMELNQ